ncbi:MAG: GIY-YIG nuclease family protein [Bacteroidia bacterium]|nr:GIY-YIG nuclease family protein [Bacteroidia bacterium]
MEGATLFYVYIIQSQVDNSLYIGYSKNPRTRLFKHNSSSAGYTSRKKPWSIVYIEEFKSKTEAIKREKKLKAWKDKSMIKDLINSSNNVVGSFRD